MTKIDEDSLHAVRNILFIFQNKVDGFISVVNSDNAKQFDNENFSHLATIHPQAFMQSLVNIPAVKEEILRRAT